MGKKRPEIILAYNRLVHINTTTETLHEQVNAPALSTVGIPFVHTAVTYDTLKQRGDHQRSGAQQQTLTTDNQMLTNSKNHHR